MKMIFSADSRGLIGIDGDLAFGSPEDLKRFKGYTTNHTIIMGRGTWESLGDLAPLPKRKSIVVTRDPEFKGSPHTLSSFQEVLEYEESHPNERVFIIGGKSLLEGLAKDCDTIYFTRVENPHQSPKGCLETKVNLDLIFEGFELTLAKKGVLPMNDYSGRHINNPQFETWRKEK